MEASLFNLSQVAGSRDVIDNTRQGIIDDMIAVQKKLSEYKNGKHGSDIRVRNATNARNDAEQNLKTKEADLKTARAELARIKMALSKEEAKPFPLTQVVHAESGLQKKDGVWS